MYLHAYTSPRLVLQLPHDDVPLTFGARGRLLQLAHELLSLLELSAAPQQLAVKLRDLLILLQEAKGKI